MKKLNKGNKLFNKISKIIYLFIFFLLFLYNVTKKKENNLINDKLKQIYNNNLFIDYISNCTQLKLIRKKSKRIHNNYPFLSVCLSVYNSEKYIEKALLSVINQSFQDFEIIIINDFSNDNTNNIIELVKRKENRITIINHKNNLGTYHSRVEGILNSRGKYIIFLDPDDLFLNPYLFEILFNYYTNYNTDIIEFIVYQQNEGKNKIFFPKNSEINHKHNFNKKFLFQPELSNILFYKPNTKNYSSIICRTVWSKIFKKKLMIEAINYIGNNYYNSYIIVIEDTILNVAAFQFASNYTSIDIPGYLYMNRKLSITHLKPTKEYIIKKSISFFLFYDFFYRYIKEFNKDINYFYFDYRLYGRIILKLKEYNVKEYLPKVKNMFIEIINNNKTITDFKNLIKREYKLLLQQT